MRLLLLLFACGVAWAQSAVNVQFGGLACAAIRRPPASVQTYCYAYPPNPGWTLVHNQIDTVPPVGGIIVSFANLRLDGDVAVGGGPTWHFWQMEDGTIKYEYVTGHAGGVDPLVSGTLP